jgi:uncharacterized protein YdeI (YjbR/CyaY-like superfamily)
MPIKDKRVDDYISKAKPFAQPVLKHIRSLVHKAIPEIEETMKWSFPHFEYKGNICSFASFKEHLAFGFWKAAIMKDPDKILVNANAMGQLGKIKSLTDLPPDKILINYLKEAQRLNDEGIKLPATTKTGKPKPPLEIPVYFLKAIKKDKKAFETFENFSPSHKREYVEWITEAKTDTTRDKRITSAIEMMSEGKPRNWKYMKK